MSGDSNNKTRIFIAIIALISLGIFLRLIPLPENFAPVGAIALIGGAAIRSRYSLLVVMAIMIVSDFFLGLHDTILFTWGSYALIAVLSSRYLARRFKLENVLLGSIAASLLFFVVTNFGVWLVGDLYSPTFAGLIQSYEMALPFFRNTFLSDLLFSSTLYGVYVMARSYHLAPTILRQAEQSS